MEFLCDSKYLIFPISYHAQKKRLLFYIDGKLDYELNISLDYDQPDYEFSLNVECFAGKTIRLECTSDIDFNIKKSDVKIGDYDGKYRDLAHYTAKRGWIGDPNGLTYYRGKYLMFYQHSPVEADLSNVHWGYAVSDDLIHWQEKDPVLYPNEDGYPYSGSAVVDYDNVSGLKCGDDDPIFIFYTRAGTKTVASRGKPFTQNAVYSLDGGKTFVPYEKNPVVGRLCAGNRDPKVFRYDDGSYIMVLYLIENDFALFKSTDLLNWHEIQRITLPDNMECPDLYPLPVDGDANNVKWIFTAAADKYFIGSFDGEKYTPESGDIRLGFGNRTSPYGPGSGSYAGQTWSGVPGDRRIRTAFAELKVDDMPFANRMNIPQEMSLKTLNKGLRLCAQPVKEFEQLYKSSETFGGIKLTAETPFSHKVSGKCFNVELKIKTEKNFAVSLFGLKVEYDAEAKMLKCLGREAPAVGDDGIFDLRAIFDAMYTEIFADQGSVFMGMVYYRDTNLNRLKIESEDAEIISLKVNEVGAFYEQK